jgi:hypothetical protein
MKEHREGSDMPDDLNSIRSQIRQILLSDWDPTNASRSEAAAGSYDDYIDPLHDMIQSNVGEGAIVDYLYDREGEIMCFPGLGKQRLIRVARRLLSLRDVTD